MLKNNLEVKAFKKILDDDCSLNKFCEICNIKVIDFFSICEGRYIPKLETALKLAEVLECKVEDIFVLCEDGQ